MKILARYATPLIILSIGAILFSIIKLIKINWLYCLIPIIYIAIPSFIGHITINKFIVNFRKGIFMQFIVAAILLVIYLYCYQFLRYFTASMFGLLSRN